MHDFRRHIVIEVPGHLVTHEGIMVPIYARGGQQAA